jgi:hypothetical protein
MAAITSPQPVKLICGLITSNVTCFATARTELKRLFGNEDLVSGILPFDLTEYYDDEMGTPLLRQFLAYETLIDPGMLGPIKRTTNQIEADLADRPPRRVARTVNIDPGYVAQSKLVLGSMKDFAHRVYLGEGVYAEVTLQYRGGWQALPWTFPDYASGRYDAFLRQVRDRLREQARNGKD